MVATTYMATVTATATAECGGCTAVAEKWAECGHGPVSNIQFLSTLMNGKRGAVMGADADVCQVVFPFRTVTAPTKTETRKVCWETPVWVGLD